MGRAGIGVLDRKNAQRNAPPFDRDDLVQDEGLRQSRPGFDDVPYGAFLSGPANVFFCHWALVSFLFVSGRFWPHSSRSSSATASNRSTVPQRTFVVSVSQTGSDRPPGWLVGNIMNYRVP